MSGINFHKRKVFMMIKVLSFLFLTSAFLVSAAEVNLALKKNATASSCERSTTSPELAVDNNPKTRWASKFVDPQWFMIDPGKPEKIGRIVIHWENAYAKEYKIQLSMDGKHWKEVFFTKDGKGKKETVKIPSQTARYVRFAGGKRASWAGYSFWEFQIFEQ